MKLTLLALAAALPLQTPSSSPREPLNLQRPLTAAEVGRVVGGIRQAETA